jgi:hypothetical protein
VSRFTITIAAGVVISWGGLVAQGQLSHHGAIGAACTRHWAGNHIFHHLPIRSRQLMTPARWHSRSSLNGLPVGSGSSLWRARSSSGLQLIAKTGDIGPVGGHTFTTFSSPAVSGDDNVLIYDRVGASITGLWKKSNVLQSIAQVGVTVPTQAGVLFNNIASGYESHIIVCRLLHRGTKCIHRRPY